MAKTIHRVLTKGVFTVFFIIPLVIIIQIPIFLLGATLGAYLSISNQLPEIPELVSYKPKTVSTFFSDDGSVIGIFYKQKRFVVDLDQIPQNVINAFLAAEDSRFFQHDGVDYYGILRAIARNIAAGRIAQGGSTITMQVTRNFLLSRERTFSRKFKEMILASRLEKVWGKEKILYVYLNEIYLGEGCYGVEAAARGYFDKPVEHLTTAQAALLAGLVASPARFNPFKSEELARQRQLTVLGRMQRAGFINEAEFEQAKSEQLIFRKAIVRPFDLAPDFTEVVRRYIIRKYGEEKLYNDGLKVFTTCKLDFQRRALEAMERGLDEIKTRQKHLAILRTIPQNEISDLLERRITPTLTEDKIYQGVVTRVTPQKSGEVFLDVAISKKLKGRVRVQKSSASVYKVGQVLALKFNKFVDDVAEFLLDDNPRLQGALVCIENKNGNVRALVGGSTGEHFQFNRAVQAKRQPGSVFKPIIYSLAFEQKSYSPATVIVDEPIVVDLEGDDEEWEPKNSGGNFMGPISVRRALELSRNICTIKILMDVGLGPVLDLAKKMGISSPLGRNLSLSLGTSELTLMELTSAYTVFPNSGIHVEPILVKRVEDRFGNVLEDNAETPVLDEAEIPSPTPRDEFKEQFLKTALRLSQNRKPTVRQAAAVQTPFTSALSSQTKGLSQADWEEDDLLAEPSRAKAALSPQTAYIMTSLLQGGVRQGTGARLSQYLKRKDLAGKTGTTNNAEDAWFIGFNPDFTTGVWVGFDEKRPLGRREEGARAALPVWAYFMKDVLQNRPEREFTIPPQITFKEMLTYPADQKDINIPRIVREPIYTPFDGLTLVMAPMDLPESLASSPSGPAQALLQNQSVFGGPVFGFFPNTSSSSLNPLNQNPMGPSGQEQQHVRPPQAPPRPETRNNSPAPGQLIKPVLAPHSGPVSNPTGQPPNKQPGSDSKMDVRSR
ncbi:MAG: PBP1A family penicillin-binding protein [Syntrophaceae bacterium]|nr:PBP1A family penicillin-binding protein [Syntrophaceae bacterium]